MPVKKEELKMNQFEHDLIVGYIRNPVFRDKQLSSILFGYDDVLFNIESKLAEYQKKLEENNIHKKINVIRKLETKRDVAEKKREYYAQLSELYDSIDRALLLANPQGFYFFKKIYIDGASQKEVAIDSGYSGRYITKTINEMINLVYNNLDKQALKNIEGFFSSEKDYFTK